MKREPGRWRGPIRVAGALAAAILLAAGTSHAAPEYKLTGYGDFRFGMTLAEAAAMIGEAEAIDRGNGLQLIETPVMAAGRPAVRQLVFEKDLLTSIVFRWEPARDPRSDSQAQCRQLFEQLYAQLAGRYGEPALGPHQQPEALFSGASFWSFPNAASISLVVVRNPGGKAACRATLNYKDPPEEG